MDNMNNDEGNLASCVWCGMRYNGLKCPVSETASIYLGCEPCITEFAPHMRVKFGAVSTEESSTIDMINLLQALGSLNPTTQQRPFGFC